MKKRILSLLSFAVLACAVSFAQEKPQPLAQIQIQSFDALTANAKRIGAALGLSPDWNPAGQLGGALGSPDLAGVDRGRPWQLALALRNPGLPPLIALYVPVTKFDTFKEGLQEGSALKGAANPNDLFQAGRFAIVVFRTGPAGELFAEDRQKVTAWAPGAAAGAHLLEIAVQPDETARQQALQFLAIGRMGVIQALAGQKPPAGVPFNPQAMTQIIGLYIDGIETILKGLKRAEFQADLSDQSITLVKSIQPLPDSELARWIKSAGGGISDLAKHLDPKATISVAGAIGDKPEFMTLLKKLVRVSFQMQNQEVDEKLASQTDKMLDALMPMRFVGSGDFGKTLSFSGFYEFPGSDVKKAYASLKQFFTNAMPSLTGTNKAYSSFAFKEGYRKIGGQPVDRFSMTMNLDAPMFKMPGQREALERLWGGGKIEIDYTIKANRMYLASPEGLAGLLETTTRPRATTGLAATGNTAFIGRANILALIKQGLAVNPMIPAGVREKFEQMNTEGGDIRFRVDRDSRLSGRVDVPLKVLEAFRAFQTAK